MATRSQSSRLQTQFGREYEITKGKDGGICFLPGEQGIQGATLMPSSAIYAHVPLLGIEHTAHSGLPHDIKLTFWEIDSSRDYVANHYGIIVETSLALQSAGLALSIMPYVRRTDGRWEPEPDLQQGDGRFHVSNASGMSLTFPITSRGWRTYLASKDAALVVISVTREGETIARTPHLALPNYKLESAIQDLLRNRGHKRLDFTSSTENLTSVPSIKPALFGTSGVRGKLGYDIGEDTILVTSQALVNHIRQEGFRGPVIIGGDTRFSSEDFARSAAEVFAANWELLSPEGKYPAVIFMDIPLEQGDPQQGEGAIKRNDQGEPVIIQKPYVPTPLMTFVIRQVTPERPAASAGVTMTASHNFGTDNGYKSLRGIKGGIAQQEVTDRLQLDANAMLQRGELVPRLDFETASQSQIGEIRDGNGSAKPVYVLERRNPREAYFREHLGRYVDFDVIRRSRPLVAVDLLFGTGNGFLDKVLEDAIAHQEWPIIQRKFHYWRDPSFGGGRPDCEDPQNIRDMIAYCEANQDRIDVGLSVDSDSDRFGIVDPELGLVNANHIIAALYKYRHENPLGRPLEVMGSTLPACRTIVTTHMLDAMARHLGGKLLALPRIGFKWIGDRMNDEGLRFIIAGEESSGLSVIDFPEKDGILADLLVLEMMCAYGQQEVNLGKRKRAVKPLREILREVWQQYGPWYIHRTDLYGIKRKQKVMDYFRHYFRPESIAGHPMEEPNVIKAMFSFYEPGDDKRQATEENRITGANPLVGDGVKYYLKLTPDELDGYADAPWAGDGIVGASVQVRESGNEPVIRVYTQHRTSRRAMEDIEAEIVSIIREVDR